MLRLKTVVGLLSLMAFAFGNLAEAQTQQDEQAVHGLPQVFSNAWAKHDGHELAKIMAEDVDFVTIGATWISGRVDFEKYHTRLLGGRFKESTITPLETAVRFIRPDLAIIHWSWRVQSDRNPDASARPPRFGLMTMLAEKRKGTWFVVVAQNTNGGLEAPELQDIKSPIAVPTGTEP
jgi:uncharacterized protein (TIGR02246 family)